MGPPKDKLAFWRASWRTLQPGRAVGLADVGPGGRPRNRTVIIRESRPETAELLCFTDRRSAKASGWVSEPKIFHWLHWDEEASIQFGGSGATRWLHPEESATLFSKLAKHSLKAYATVRPPGTAQAQPGNDLPSWWHDGPIAAERLATIREYFGVLITRLDRVDLLYLSREANIRMRARRQSGDWSFEWIVP
jgi:hypothetical protein